MHCTLQTPFPEVSSSVGSSRANHTIVKPCLCLTHSVWCEPMQTHSRGVYTSHALQKQQVAVQKTSSEPTETAVRGSALKFAFVNDVTFARHIYMDKY